MKFHPYSELFPMLQGADFDELVADIKQHGLREPIWTYRSQILDGRNRFAACQKANEKPRFQEFVGDDSAAQSFVISINLHRRHLNESQRASIAAKLAKLEPGQRLETGKFAGLTQEKAAKALNVSERSVRAAKKVHEKGSAALNKALDQGDVSASRAAAVVDLPKSEQLKAATTKSEPAKEEKADLSEFLTKEEVARHDADEKRLMDSLERAAGDSAAEIKRLNGLLTEAYRARDRYMNECAALKKQVAAQDRELKRLRKAAA